MNLKNLRMIHKLDLRILRLVRYGTGKKAEKLFNPLVFQKRFDLPSFSFEDYKLFASEFTKSEVHELIEFTKDEIMKLDAEIKEIKNYYSSQAQSKFISPLRISHAAHKTWGVMDFETYTTPGRGAQIPYAWGFKIGESERITIEFETPYPAIQETLYEISSLIEKKAVIYIHNLSQFDSYFLINAALTANLDLEVIKTEKGFIAVVVKISGKEIHFHDSLLLLPSSLRDLSASFKVENPKQYFPYLFVSPDRAEYEGPKPDIENYIDIPEDVYENMPKCFNMKQEIRAYLRADLLSLYEVLEVFMRRVLAEYGISITNMLTLPQLAFTIWRVKYLKWREVLILPASIESDIRRAYYGGACEVYRPAEKRAWFYDVNSMYPWAMTQPMPIGRGVAHLWDSKPYEDIMDDFFGFLNVEITIEKDSTYAPVLPRNINGQMLFATGTWVGWYFSEELKFAYKTGLYKINVLQGYAFKKGENFLTGYVEEFYKMKTEAKDSVTRSIAKLLLNSLYGRFGMKKITHETVIGGATQPVQDLHDMVTLDTHTDKILYTLYSDKVNVVSNVALAAAITSYSRIKSFSVIREYEEHIMYHDTDSFVLNTSIDPEFLGDGLGQMKNVVADENYVTDNDHDYYITNPLFVAPKVYCFETPKGEKIVKIKGIRKGDQRPDIVEKMYYDMKVVRETTQFKRYIKNLEVVIRKMTKKLRTHNNKRIKELKQGVWIDTKPLDIKN